MRGHTLWQRPVGLAGPVDRSLQGMLVRRLHWCAVRSEPMRVRRSWSKIPVVASEIMIVLQTVEHT